MKNNRRILIILPNPPTYPGGVERIMNFLGDLLSKNGFKVDFLYFDNLSANFKSLVRIFEFFKLRELALNIVLKKMERSISRKYDLVITNGYLGAFLNAQGVHVFHGTAIGYLKALKVLLTYPGRMRFLLLGWLERKAGAKREVVAVSKKCAQEVEEFYKLKVAKVIQNRIDLSRFFPVSEKEKALLRKRLGLPQKAFIILFVGRLEAGKGVALLNELMTKIKREDVFFLICTNVLNSKNIVLQPNVRYELNLDIDQISQRYQASDVLFFPSFYEGFELSTLEALACGIPVVGFEVGALAELGKNIHCISDYILPVNSGVESCIRALLHLKCNYPKVRKCLCKIVPKILDPNKFERAWVEFLNKLFQEYHGKDRDCSTYV